ncbi:MAG: helix-turn-helix transcriptional regulator [Lachnospiraceae bacterium]|nr:helix-turn-helix transcriptional regulator [Lachnospiraceae bacterium]
MATLGERMKELLEKKKMTQHDLAERVGCTEAAISHYIKGDRIPRSSVLAKIAVTLDTTSDYLSEGVPVDSRNELVYAKKLIARNASKMTTADKREILSILMGDADG